MAKRKFYAVKKGNSIGVFSTWTECQAATAGYPGAEFKSFETNEEALAYLDNRDIVMENDILPRLNQSMVVAFTDGSFDSSKNAYGAGSCIYAPDRTPIELANKGANEKYISLRNVAGEIIAVLNTIDWAWKNGYDKLAIFFDYEGIGKWASGEWKANNPLSKYYQRYIDEKKEIISLEFVKVSGHSNNIYNDRADRLAKSAIFENKIIRDRDGNSGYIISPVKVDDIVSLLDKLKEECQGLEYSLSDNGNKKVWSIFFKHEKVCISLFNNIKMAVQGKKSNLFQIVTTGIMETIQCGDFIQVLKSAYSIAIDKVQINDDFNNYLPNIASANLPDNIVTLLKQAIVNLNNPARNDTEFSMYVFPALRALEGILKYNLSKCSITMTSHNFNMFGKDHTTGVYMLQRSHAEKIDPQDVQKLENCYNHLHNNRHTLFHFGIILGCTDANTRLLRSKEEANSIIQETLSVINANCIL